MSSSSSSSRSLRSSISPFRSRKSPAQRFSSPAPGLKHGGRPSTPQSVTSSSSRPPSRLSSSTAGPSSSPAGQTPDRLDANKSRENVAVTVRFRPLSASLLGSLIESLVQRQQLVMYMMLVLGSQELLKQLHKEDVLRSWFWQRYGTCTISIERIDYNYFKLSSNNITSNNNEVNPAKEGTLVTMSLTNILAVSNSTVSNPPPGLQRYDTCTTSIERIDCNHFKLSSNSTTSNSCMSLSWINFVVIGCGAIGGQFEMVAVDSLNGGGAGGDIGEELEMVAVDSLNGGGAGAIALPKPRYEQVFVVKLFNKFLAENDFHAHNHNPGGGLLPTYLLTGRMLVNDMIRVAARAVYDPFGFRSWSLSWINFVVIGGGSIGGHLEMVAVDSLNGGGVGAIALPEPRSEHVFVVKLFKQFLVEKDFHTHNPGGGLVPADLLTVRMLVNDMVTMMPLFAGVNLDPLIRAAAWAVYGPLGFSRGPSLGLTSLLLEDNLKWL
ncbi:unnamed protein product [Linum tenue]|uniref:Uncharacterized protein n=1 Tax=Linum tenue TaxID=586396 RepID=A0AAV0NM66_9ROSI|nr:unnamed protein product [Linum tenue]